MQAVFSVRRAAAAVSNHPTREAERNDAWQDNPSGRPPDFRPVYAMMPETGRIGNPAYEPFAPPTKAVEPSL
ncbi:hypothetical protein GCM10011494_26480 [Novosphingobium endophyticum]|uniref:Uncharacterized protein n=1 Tax=Novosphingobium endophyticum TaxID=1955250 RepID=A0A916TW61_9SPHN|nr:hypothetical protein GCM10011494_26480 [Novosphingobium endophyticum]